MVRQIKGLVHVTTLDVDIKKKKPYMFSGKSQNFLSGEVNLGYSLVGLPL